MLGLKIPKPEFLTELSKILSWRMIIGIRLFTAEVMPYTDAEVGVASDVFMVR